MELCNIKIRINNETENRKVQEYLFKNGFSWANGKSFNYPLANKLYTHNNGSLEYGDSTNSDYFNNDSRREVTLKELLRDSGIRYMIFETGCSNTSNIMTTETEMKKQLTTMGINGKAIGYKLIPIMEAEKKSVIKRL